MTERIKPLHDQVLLHRHGKPELSPGGLHLPKKRAHDPYEQATVLAVGPGRHQRPPEVAVGDVVLIPMLGGGMSFRDIDGRDLAILRERDIMAVVES